MQVESPAPRRGMKFRRLIFIFAPFVCLGFCFLFVSVFTKDIPRAHAQGERLKISTLAPNEEIVVSKFFGHRTVTEREYRIGKDGDPRRVTVFDLSPAPGTESQTSRKLQALAVRSLTQAEAEGLDETVAYFRRRGEEHSSATRQYRLLYFRDGKKIGEEFFVGFSLPDALINGGWTSHASDTEFQMEYGASRTEVGRMIMFETLEKEPPDKSR